MCSTKYGTNPATPSPGGVMPRLFMKTLPINNFTIKLLSKLLGDLSIEIHLKVVFDTKTLGSKVNNRQYFHMKNSLSMKKLSINNFTTKPFKWTPI